MDFQLIDQLQTFRRGVYAANTVQGYAADWSHFRAWCDTQPRQALPATPETIALYLTHLLLVEQRKVGTAERRACAIVHYHRQEGHPSPISKDVRRLLTGARRIRHEKPRQMRPLSVAQLRVMAASLLGEGTATAARNRAILVVGLASGLRCSSLVELRLDDLTFAPQGAVLTIRFEKQDQEGKGRLLGLPYGEHSETCPVMALEFWLTYRGNLPGPLFTRLDPEHCGERMERNRVRKIVQGCLRRAGIDPKGYGGHSMRAGLVTEAAENGVSELVIAAQTGHRSMEVLRRYFRRTDLFRSNAASMIGL